LVVVVGLEWRRVVVLELVRLACEGRERLIELALVRMRSGRVAALEGWEVGLGGVDGLRVVVLVDLGAHCGRAGKEGVVDGGVWIGARSWIGRRCGVPEIAS
jgi:hypothetical protein